MAWKKGIAVLTAGHTKVSPDERIRLVDGNNLEIRDIQTNDAGNYVCQIATLKPREISHTVEILGEFAIIAVIAVVSRINRKTYLSRIRMHTVLLLQSVLYCVSNVRL